MTKREQNALRAIKDALKSHELSQDARQGLIDALQTLRDYFADRENLESVTKRIGNLYKPYFDREPTPEQTAYNTAVRDALGILDDRKEGIA